MNNLPLLLRRKTLYFMVCALMLSASASSAQAQNRLDLPTLIPKVAPSIVRIEITVKGERVGSGSGLVVDSSGIIATNYHVIEGATEMFVSIPSKKDDKKFPVKGFLGYIVGKDLALLVIDPGDKQLAALPLAANPPKKGDPVAAFGAPVGFSSTVTEGVVSAVRTGKELCEWMKMGDKDVYTQGLGYDLDANWLQTSTPIPPGNSGGPMVNADGEAVGMNTFASAKDGYAYYALSSEHMRMFINTVDKKKVQPLANLPLARPGRLHYGDTSRTCNLEKTLELWKHVSRAFLDLDNTIESCEENLQNLPPVEPDRPKESQIARNKLIAENFKTLSEAFSEYAKRLNDADFKAADAGLICLVVMDARVAKKLSDNCKDFAKAATPDAAAAAVDWATALSKMRSSLAEVFVERELLRLHLSRKYNKYFPNMDETGKGEKKEKDAQGSNTKKNDEDPTKDG